MSSVRYFNQTAPFWDFVASLEERGSNHPFFADRRGDGHDDASQGHGFGFGPWSWGWGGPHGRHGHHGPPGPPGPHGPHGPHGPRGVPHRPHHRGPPPPPPDMPSGPPPPFDHDGPAPPPPFDFKEPPHSDDEQERPSSPTPPAQDSNEDTAHPHRGCHGRRGRCGGRGRRGRFGGWNRDNLGGNPFFFDVMANILTGNGNNMFGTSNDNNNNNGESSRDAQDDFKPEADVFDTESSFIVHVSLPGAKREDVGVNWDAEKSELSIAGVVYRPGDEDLLNCLALDERKVGAFERKVRLGSRASPAQVDSDMITAKLEDGVLRVNVPKLDKDYVEIKKVDVE